MAPSDRAYGAFVEASCSLIGVARQWVEPLLLLNRDGCQNRAIILSLVLLGLTGHLAPAVIER